MAGRESISVRKILDTPTDWKEWIANVKSLAIRDHDIWHLINPDLKDEPQPLQKPSPPAYSTFKAGATSLADLDQKQAEAWKAAYQLYRDHDMLDYTQKSQMVRSIYDYIDNTVSQRNKTYLNDTPTLWKKLTALKARLAPSDRIRKIELSREYARLKHYDGNQSMEQWIMQWEAVHKECKDLSMPEVSGDAPQYDFLLAVARTSPAWASAYELQLNKETKEKKELTKIADLIEDYRLHLRLQSTIQAPENHTANAAFKGQRKDSSNASDRSQCPCGMQHSIKKCWQLNPELRPEGRSLSWIAVQNIIKKAEADPAFKKRLEKDYAEGWKQIQERAKNDTKPKTTEATTTSKKDEKKTLGSFAARGNELNNSYKLQNHWILDSGSDVHICNNVEKFKKTSNAHGAQVTAGKTTYAVEAYGNCHIDVQTETGIAQIELLNVALIPGFMTNIVALPVLNRKGIHWNTRMPWQLEDSDKNHFCNLHQIDSHWVISYDDSCSSFATSRSEPKIQEVSKTDLHQILGHPGPEAVEKVPDAVEGIKVKARNEKAPTTVDCEHCAMAKATQHISKSNIKDHVRNGKPFDEIAWDMIYLREGYNGHHYLSHIRCINTGYDIVETHSSPRDALPLFIKMTTFIEQHYGFKIRFVTLDGERNLQGEFVSYCAKKGYQIQRSAPQTQAQNGAAEVSGKQLIIRMRAMRLEANLPQNLWPEIAKAAAYLGNRTPAKRLNWKTPFELVMGMKPSLAHLRPYGCRAYALNKNIPKLDKLEARAHLGHLVGYDSTNVFRIWIPSLAKVIRTRDVTFNTKKKFRIDDVDLGMLIRDEINTVMLQMEATGRVNEVEAVDDEVWDTIVVDVPPAEHSPEEEESDSTLEDLSEESANESSGNNENPENLQTSTNQNAQESADTQTKLSDLEQDQLPTPDNSQIELDSDTTSSTSSTSETEPTITTLSTRNTATRASEISSDIDTSNIIGENRRTRSAHSVHHHAFSTFLSSRDKRIHRDQLPPEPQNWTEAMRHPYAAEWMKAAEKELQTLMRKGTFEYVPASTTDSSPLPLKWVPKYKFDADGFLDSFKMRLCARGDLQQTDDDTYAATLAAQTFRVIMALVAAFDLDTRQYDAINAFVNALLRPPIYCKAPPGFDKTGFILLVRRALYGLKISPNLWYSLLVSVLEELGVSQVPGVNCLFTNDWLTLLFYVDDIVAVYHPKHTARMNEFEHKLMQRFEIRAMGEINHFLGIRVIRKREERKLFMIQDSYIHKLQERFKVEHRSIKTPLPMQELVKNEGIATEAQIKAYQNRVGSLTYAAIISRPDIAKAISKLAEFQQNPSQQHIDAANHCLQYLVSTKNLAIVYDGNIDAKHIFMAASDAAFGDDPLTRFSSNGFCFMLYGGVIHYKATKQRTVTTSSTEAELLALSQTGKEFVWWKRLLENIGFDLDQEISIYCDNQQTIRLLSRDTPRLTTKLKHVDVHSCWLRQEVQAKRLKIDWIPTGQMVADGFTKLLTPQKHANFLKQLRLIDITEELQETST
jgi:hypothetical protein